jgi:hypothetical protein
MTSLERRLSRIVKPLIPLNIKAGCYSIPTVTGPTTFGRNVFRGPRCSFAIRLFAPRLSNAIRFFHRVGDIRARCRELVAEGVAADRKNLDEIKKKYLQGAVRLRDFRVERNGNGRDFDIIPPFIGVYAHGHILRFEILRANTRQEAVILHSSGYYVDANSNLRIFCQTGGSSQVVS